MFRKLRTRLILINLGITSVVIVVMFTAIYLISTQSANNRPPMTPTTEISITTPEESANSSNGEMSEDVRRIVTFTVREEKQAAARQLLIMLIVSGVAIEIAVALVSYYLADQAIKPVKEAYEAQKVFIANASHEIKTPLAAISANLEAADLGSENKWIRNVELETEKLTTLNTELLTLARTDLVSTDSTSKVEETDVAKLVEDEVKILLPRFSEKEIATEIYSKEKVKINRGDFAQLLNILLDNAIKYSDRKIIVTLSEHKLSVSNDGAKISPEQIEHVFDRFYQADKTSEGVGLGLSIAKSLAERNHWKLSVQSDKMTTFTINF